MREFTRVFTINGIEGYDAQGFLQDAQQNITSVLRNNRRTKVKLILKCIMEKQTSSGMLIVPADFHSNIEVNLEGTDEEELYYTMVERILENMATFQREGSAWRLLSIIQLHLHIVRYNPLRRGTYIPLPKELTSKKAIINMKNSDNRCFLWCVLRALNPKVDHPEKVDTKGKGKYFKYEGNRLSHEFERFKQV